MTQNRELAEVLQLLDIFFEGDTEKISNWMNYPNPNLGGATPVGMILNGRGRKLIQFMTNEGKANGWINDVQEQDSKHRSTRVSTGPAFPDPFQT